MAIARARKAKRLKPDDDPSKRTPADPRIDKEEEEDDAAGNNKTADKKKVERPSPAPRKRAGSSSTAPKNPTDVGIVNTVGNDGDTFATNVPHELGPHSVQSQQARRTRATKADEVGILS